MMRKSTVYIALTASGATLLVLLAGIHPIQTKSTIDKRLQRERAVVDRLQLTDIALVTEAPYTRHPSLADRFSAFQNHPMALSQFPSESLLVPPAHILRDMPAAGSRDEQRP